MTRLGFSQAEKDWATLLYSVMAEDQRVTVGDTDGSGYYGTDYGDITFTNAETPVVYYNQTDARWGNKPYGKTSTIGRAGCGPTALAIAVASLTGNKVTPYDVAQWSVANGGLCEGSGSYHSLIPNGGRHYGLTVTSIGRDGKKLVEALQEGKLVIAIMTKGHFTNSGHFIVLRGVTSDGKLLVADPASVKRSNYSISLYCGDDRELRYKKIRADYSALEQLDEITQIIINRDDYYGEDGVVSIEGKKLVLVPENKYTISDYIETREPKMHT